MGYECRDINIEGLVQGVGFRPFLRQLADRYQITGWSKNTSRGVSVKVGGSSDNLALFLAALQVNPPKHAAIDTITITEAEAIPFSGFQIHSSVKTAHATRVPPDVVMCQSCQSELFDPSDRRYQYPFTTCCECGPRFTILNDLPFDRCATTMAHFPMCQQCRVEYSDPANRRFHAQTISCFSCGPEPRLTDSDNNDLSTAQQVFSSAAELLRAGKTLAIKGLGGYQLACLASLDTAVLKLRQGKRRKEKPLAIMVRDIPAAHRLCQLSDQEINALESKEGPIVIVSRRSTADVSKFVACELAEFGLMLPSSPLHHMLLQLVDAPLVVTSGNRSGEPIIINDNQALQSLASLCDGFLTHNRPIAHKADDPVVRIIDGAVTLFRTGRGFSPNYFPAYPPGLSDQSPILATGSHSKNTFAVCNGSKVILSQHMGTLDSPGAFEQFNSEVQFYRKIHRVQQQAVICDCHPDYGSTALAQHWAADKVSIQHHRAHVMACAFEHNFQGPGFCVAWDGLGLGDDSTAWGGEFFALDTDNKSLDRVATMRSFKLPGGDRAAMEPRRCALALLSEVFGTDYVARHLDLPAMQWASSFSAQEWAILTGSVNSTAGNLTSSVGRLFDGVAAILAVKHICSFDGQAAMLLESVADKSLPFKPFSFKVEMDRRFAVIDWRPAIHALCVAMDAGIAPKILAARFHHTLAAVVVHMCESRKEQTVLLSGGVFQNRFLTELILDQLGDRGVKVLRNAKIPSNDGGLSVGQIAYQRYQIGSSPCV